LTYYYNGFKATADLLTWSERITVLWIEKNFKSSDAIVEGTLRNIKDWKLHGEGDHGGKQDGEDGDDVDDLVDTKGPQPLVLDNKDVPHDGNEEWLEEAVQPDEVIEEEHDHAAAKLPDNVDHWVVENLYCLIHLKHIGGVLLKTRLK
jgi:hypothetical protein